MFYEYYFRTMNSLSSTIDLMNLSSEPKKIFSTNIYIKLTLNQLLVIL